MKKNYKSTVNACFAGYVVQAIVNNFVPLLFLTFNKSYGIELSKITADNRADNRQFYSPAHNRPALRVLYR